MQQLPRISTVVRAPRVYVFRTLTSFDEPGPWWGGGAAGDPVRPPEVVDRQADTVVVRLPHRRLGHTVRITTRVAVEPPWRIRYQRLDDPVGEVEEEMVLTADAKTTVLEHRASVTTPVRLGRPVLERLAAKLLERELRATIDRYRVTIEAAALAADLAAGGPAAGQRV